MSLFAFGRNADTSLRQVALAQGLYYAVTGFWPVLNMRTFAMLSGPKKDDWLVRTVGLLLTVIGVVLLLARRQRKISPEIPLLGAGSALSLAAIDVTYVSKGRILPIYLLDAALELGLLLWWARAWQNNR